MDADPVVAALPRVFTTEQYRSERGIAPSSASRALRVLTSSGQVRSLGRGWWSRPLLQGEANPPLIGSPPGLWSPELECLFDALFGASPRRIGYLSALAAAGVPLTHPLAVVTSNRPSARVASAGLAHVRESENTFAVASRRFSEHTAISEPDRALLECAQFPRHAARCEEHIGYAVCWGADTFDPGRVRALSEQFGWRAGLRRIASIADGLARSAPTGDVAVRPAGAWAELAAEVRRGDRWISLNNRTARRYADTGWTDAHRQVLWWTTPDALARQIAG